MDLTHILVVESDPALAAKLKHALERADGVCVATVAGLSAALRDADSCTPDFIVIDLNCPVIDGFEVAQVLRSRQSISARPVLMLQRRRAGELIEDCGPVIDETLLRRKLAHVFNPAQSRQLDPWSLTRYCDDHLTADFDTGRFRVDGRLVDLTVREQELLRVLIEQAHRVVTRRALHDRLWGYETRSLDVHVRRLRYRLGAASKQIETVPGFGYRFVPDGVSSRIPEPTARSGNGSDAAA